MKKQNFIKIILFFIIIFSLLCISAYADYGITHEAENAALSGLCAVKEEQGVSGGKSVGTIDYNPGGQESTVTFTVSAPKDGVYIVYVFASGNVASSPNPAHDYYVNGDSGNRQTVYYTNASVWTAPSAYALSIPLKMGVNTISFTYHYAGEPWWATCAEIDCIRVIYASHTLLPVALEAEDCYLTGTARATTSVGAFDNAKVGYIDNRDATVNFKITVPEDGEYTAFVHADGGVGFSNDVMASHAVYVNGDKANQFIVRYPNARFWDIWYDYPICLSLKAGENTVTFTHSGEIGSFAELDRVTFFVPGTWSVPQPEGIITLTKAHDLPGSSYTFDGSIFMDNNTAVGGIALMNADNTVGYMLEANAPEHRLKLYRAARNADGTWTVTMKADKLYSKIKWATIVKLRLQANENQLRCYYLNEIGGETPWAKFDFEIPELASMTQASTFTVLGRTAVLDTSISEESFSFSIATFKNPVIMGLADPDVIYHDGVYYAYGTYTNTSFDVFKSTDLVHWVRKENILANPVPWWGATVNFWAPGVAKIDGKFYLAGSINEGIGFFVSDSPEGPFHLIGDGPVFNRSIDANIFVDDDGRVYIYYVSWDDNVDNIYGIYVVEYNRTLTAPLSGITRLMVPDCAWEMVDDHITEGPFMLKHNGTYYLTYSGAAWRGGNYAIGYATMSSPMGPATKYHDNPIFIRTSDMQGTAHHGFVTLPTGELYLIYHAHKNVGTVDTLPRNVCISPARFLKSAGGAPDYLELGMPSNALQDQPFSTCQVAFDAQGGTGTMQTRENSINVIYQMPSSEFTRPGYVQTGWTLWRPFTWETLYTYNDTIAWHWQGQEPAGAQLAVVEPDGYSFLPVCAGETLYFFAHWQEGEVHYDTAKEKVYVRLPRDVEKGRVWYAVYDGDTLLRVESVEIAGTAGQTAHGELKNPKEGAQKAFLFTWDNGMMPLHMPTEVN